MKLFLSLIATAGLVAGCYQPESKVDLLAESGFKTLSLNTPAKVAAFKSMPKHVLTQTVFKGHQVWVYADRNVCGCVYVGNRAAYDTYIKKAGDQMIDMAANRPYVDPEPYNPTQMENWIYWGDAWDASDAYGLYIN